MIYLNQILNLPTDNFSQVVYGVLGAFIIFFFIWITCIASDNKRRKKRNEEKRTHKIREEYNRALEKEK